MSGEAPVNIGALLSVPFTVGQRVLEMQTKLHRWATANSGRRFDDLYNLVYDPVFLVHAWERVAGNTGARSAGVDRRTERSISESAGGVAGFLEKIRVELKTRTFRPLPVRERMIPKPGGGKKRRLGIPTVADRVVQASLKLVLEPILEVNFSPSSYGFRPKRRAQDAIEEIRFYAQQFQGVLAIAAQRRIESVSRRLNQVGRALQRPRYQTSALALDLHDQIRSFTRDSAPPALPGVSG